MPEYRTYGYIFLFKYKKKPKIKRSCFLRSDSTDEDKMVDKYP